MSRDSVSPRLEARLLGRYLLGGEPHERILEVYVRAEAYLEELDDSSSRLLSLALRHPWLLSAIDGRLAMVRSDSPLRARILAMSAILETSPEYYADFAPRAGLRSGLAAFGAGARLVASAALGTLVLRHFV